MTALNLQKNTHHVPVSFSKRMALKPMKTERRVIQLGVALSDLKMKVHLQRVMFVCQHSAWPLYFADFICVCMRPRVVCCPSLWSPQTNTCNFYAFHVRIDFSSLQKHLLESALWPSLPPTSHCGPLSVLPFPFKTGGCDARMWVLRSGPRWACLCGAVVWEMAPWQWFSWQSFSFLFFCFCLGGNCLFDAGLQAAEGLDGARTARTWCWNNYVSLVCGGGLHANRCTLTRQQCPQGLRGYFKTS